MQQVWLTFSEVTVCHGQGKVSSAKGQSRRRAMPHRPRSRERVSGIQHGTPCTFTTATTAVGHRLTAI